MRHVPLNTREQAAEKSNRHLISCRTEALEIQESALHVKFRCGEVVAILEVAALPAFLPCILVDLELAIFLARSDGIDSDLEDFSGNQFAELKLFQVRINGAEAGLHAFLCCDCNKSVTTKF